MIRTMSINLVLKSLIGAIAAGLVVVFALSAYDAWHEQRDRNCRRPGDANNTPAGRSGTTLDRLERRHQYGGQSQPRPGGIQVTRTDPTAVSGLHAMGCFFRETR